MNKALGIILTALSFPCLAMAQADSIRTIELNPVVVTGTGTYHRADNSPVAVKVISAKDIKDAQATNIVDALGKLTPDITTHTNGMGTFVNFGGISDEYMVILENGKRVTGDDRWTRISMRNIKRIEVFSGAASALYGSDAIAGVINIITEDGSNQLEASSFTKVMNNERLNQDINVDVNGRNLTSHTSYSYRQAGNWQVNPYQEFFEEDGNGNKKSVLKLNGRPMSQGFSSHNISQKFDWTLNDKISFYVRGNYYKQDTHRPQNAQAYTQKKTVDKATDETTYSYTAKNAYTYDIAHNTYLYGAGMRWVPAANTHIYLDVYSDHNQSSYNYWQTAEKEAHDETRKKTHYTNETLKGIFRLTSWMKLSGGMEFVQEALESESDHISFETTNTYNFFAQDEIKICNWMEAVAGARYTYNTHFGNHFTPNIGLFLHAGGFSLRASYAGGYRTPTLSQLYATDQAKTNSRYTLNNPSLKPEKNHFGKVGIDYSNSWMRVGVSGFINRITDMINYRTLTAEEIASSPELTELSKEWDTLRRRDNIDTALLRGVSTHIKFITGIGLIMGGGYTFTDGEVDKAVKHVANLNISYDKSWKMYHLNVALNGHIQGNRFSSTYGYAPGYSQWDLNTRHILTFRHYVLEPGIGIENIFNKVDSSYWNSNYSTISPGRSFYISLALKLNN